MASHPQEVLENAIDLNHFAHLHRMPPCRNVQLAAEGPILRAVNRFTGGPGDGADEPIPTEVTFVGLGLLVARHRADGWDGFVLTACSPLDGLLVQVRIWVTVRGELPPARLAAALDGLSGAVFANVDQDALIWSNKLCLAEPLLAPGEEGIAAFRRWATQFHRG